MKKINLIDITKGIAIGVALTLSVSVFAAWSEPSQAPTGGNVEAPINVSNASQKKGGNLVLNANNQGANGLVVPFGNVLIGSGLPINNAKLDVAGAIRSYGNNNTIKIGGTIDTINGYIISSTASYIGFFTHDTDKALPIKVGGLVVSDSYADSAPASGIFSKGNIQSPKFCNSAGTKCFDVDTLCTKVPGLCQ